MEIITGYTGKPHVTSEQDRDVNIGVVGEGSYVLKTGMQLAAEVSSNNEIKIRDGVLMHQGCTASIKKNTYDSLIITNGSQGMKRVDLIVARYEKNQDNRIESLDLKVIQGTPAESNPAAPQYTKGDIQAGDYVADMPLYKVIIDGLNITEVKKAFEIVGSNKDFSKLLDYDPTEKTYYENGWTMKYRYISHDQVYVTLQNTNTGATEAIPNNLIMAGVPLQILFEQYIPVKMVVGNVIVGYGSIMFSGKGAYLQSVAYGNSVSWFGYGVVIVE
jgi:hypothetical protein